MNAVLKETGAPETHLDRVLAAQVAIETSRKRAEKLQFEYQTRLAAAGRLPSMKAELDTARASLSELSARAALATTDDDKAALRHALAAVDDKRAALAAAEHDAGQLSSLEGELAAANAAHRHALDAHRAAFVDYLTEQGWKLRTQFTEAERALMTVRAKVVAAHQVIVDYRGRDSGLLDAQPAERYPEPFEMKRVILDEAAALGIQVPVKVTP